MSSEGKKWIVRPQDPERAQEIATTLDTSPLVGQILLNRGMDETEEALSFLNADLGDLVDPFLLNDMKKAAERIASALEKQEKILIYGDYDVDGVTATSLLLLFLRDLGFSVYYYIPNRVNEGYGINRNSIDKFKQEGISLVITVDCGISSADEISYASSQGINVIVTDHHEPPSVLPEAEALINPLLENCSFPYKALSGVGLAFYLVAGLRKYLREEGFFREGEEPLLVDYLDLVAIGTIADIVPLTGLNRILVRFGLEQINLKPRLGIKTLLSVCGIPGGEVNSTDVAYRLAPKINAAGRLSDASAGVRLLTTDNPDDAKRLAGYLDVENVERQRIEERIYSEAIEKIVSGGFIEDRHSLVLNAKDWHPGVVGIVASRLMERYYRPTVLLCMENGVWKGSSRGIPSFHLYLGLTKCEDLLLEFGGHKYAAGLKILPENLEDFRERFEQVVKELVPEDGFIPVMKLDTIASLDTLGMDEILKFKALSPFGSGNPEPVILIENVEIKSARIVGGDHLSFTATQNGRTISGIAFRQAHEMDTLSSRMDLAAVPEIQTWRGEKSVKLRVKAMRQHEKNRVR